VARYDETPDQDEDDHYVVDDVRNGAGPDSDRDREQADYCTQQSEALSGETGRPRPGGLQPAGQERVL